MAPECLSVGLLETRLSLGGALSTLFTMAGISRSTNLKPLTFMYGFYPSSHLLEDPPGSASVNDLDLFINIRNPDKT